MSVILSGTAHLLRVVTDIAANVDVVADWADLTVTGQSTVKGRTITPTITTATTTTIVASPASGVRRAVKRASIRNGNATTAVKITVLQSDGTSVPEVHSAKLSPGQELIYEERRGWRVKSPILGQELGVTDIIYGVPAVGDMRVAVLDRDVTNNCNTANQMKLLDDPGALYFPVVTGHRYWFRAVMQYTAAATTTGSRFSIFGPAVSVAIRYREEASLTTTTQTTTEGHAAYDLPAASNASSAATGANIAIVEGFIDDVEHDSWVGVRFASEIADSAIVAKAGSMLFWQRMT